MPSWLLLQSEAGFPLFSRSSGLPGAAFSFATTGLLAAASQAAAAGGFVLSRLGAHDAAVHTASYPGGLVLVLASSDAQSATPEALSARAQRAYDALLFLLGRAKLQDLRHVERTKRHIRSAANLLSLLLVDDAYVLQMGTGFPECCITSSASVFDDLRALAAACNTAHAAIYAQHRMYAWTEQWSQLDSRDLFTIAVFLRSCVPAQARDVPVYLAHSSLSGAAAAASAQNLGRTPYRLLSISLMHDLELVLLCGPAPSLMDAVAAVQTTILRGVALPYCAPSPVLAPAPPGALVRGGPQVGVFSPLYARMQSCAIDAPRHLPNSFSFFAGILGFMLIVQRGMDDQQQQQTKAAHPQRQRQQHARMVCSFIPAAPNVPPPPEPEQPTSSRRDSSKGRRSPSPRGRSSGDALSSSSSSSQQQSFIEPPSPSQFAPSNPLFASTLLSDASVLSRSHALLCFYQLVQQQLFPAPLPAHHFAPFEASPPPSPRRDSSNAAASDASEISPVAASEETPLARALEDSSQSEPRAASSVAAAAATTTPVDAAASFSPPTAASPAPTIPVEPPICTDAYMLTSSRGFYACRKGDHSLYVMFGDKVPPATHLAHSWQLLHRLEALQHNL